MEYNKVPLRMRIAIQGASNSHKLFTSLQLAYGLCGSWDKIIVIGSSSKEEMCQYLGSYNTVILPEDATPQRYNDAFNLCAGCQKDVVIFSSFSNEWSQGVEAHMTTSYYQEVLAAHGLLMRALRNSPVHVISCIDTRQRFLRYDPQSKRSFAFVHQPVQQPGFERNFMIQLRINTSGEVFTVKDLTAVLPQKENFIATPIDGALLKEWCTRHRNKVPAFIQRRIDECCSLIELSALLTEEESANEALLAAYTKRRHELERDSSLSGTRPSDNKLHLVP